MYHTIDWFSFLCSNRIVDTNSLKYDTNLFSLLSRQINKNNVMFQLFVQYDR